MTELIPIPTPIPSAMHFQYPMAHDQTQEINVSGRTIASAAENKRQFGLDVPSIAEVTAGRQHFSILDTREVGNASRPLLLVDESFHTSRNRGYKGIQENQPFIVGRKHANERFDYDPTVSSHHFTLAFDGLSLAVKNLRPTNKTLLTGDFLSEMGTSGTTSRSMVADFTHNLAKLQDSSDQISEIDPNAPYGYYQSRPIIGRWSPSVKGGVYFTHNPNSEAVIVDTESRVLQQLLGLFMHYIEPLRQQSSQGVLEYLVAVNDFTIWAMTYNEKVADRLSRPHYATNGLINLSKYVKERAGVCRHQCLVAAFLMESLVDRRIIYGQARVERNRTVDAHGAHAWAMFGTASGKDIVVDPAQEFVGTKEQAKQEKRWKYQVTLDR